MEKEVRVCAQTMGANSHRGATKKREISRTLFSINLHFLVQYQPTRQGNYPTKYSKRGDAQRCTKERHAGSCQFGLALNASPAPPLLFLCREVKLVRILLLLLLHVLPLNIRHLDSKLQLQTVLGD